MTRVRCDIYYPGIAVSRYGSRQGVRGDIQDAARSLLTHFEACFMKAVVYYGPRKLRYEEVDTPKPGRGEVLVRSEVSLTCGTDLKIYQRGHPLVRPPLILGHEFAGVIEKVGNDVTDYSEGMRVVAVNSAPCGTCYYCHRGQPSLCSKVTEELLGFSLPGSYAEFVLIPDHIVQQNLITLPANVSFEQAAILEPFACAVHGNFLAPLRTGDSVAVIGVGPIGLMHIALAKYRGAGEIIALDLSEQRLRTATEVGATHAISSGDKDPRESVAGLTEGRGADVVIEAVGRVETWEKAFNIVRRGGTVIMFGGCPSGTTASFSTEKLHYGEVTVKGSFHHDPTSVRKAFALIVEKRVNLSPLVTDRMVLRHAKEALEKMATGDVLKVALYTSEAEATV